MIKKNQPLKYKELSYFTNDEIGKLIFSSTIIFLGISLAALNFLVSNIIENKLTIKYPILLLFLLPIIQSFITLIISFLGMLKRDTNKIKESFYSLLFNIIEFILIYFIIIKNIFF